DLSDAHRRGQSQDGRVSEDRAARVCGESRARVRAVSRARRAPAPAGGQPLGRRAADARRRPRSHVAAQARPARRALDGAGARDGAASVRPDSARARGGLHDPGRRAERPTGPQARRPRVPARGGAPQDGGPGRHAGRAGFRAQGLRGPVIDPIFLAEAAVNGLLLGGVLALLALGLNLIFGVIDIVWIAYVDLVMICMYAVYFLVQVYGWPIWIGGLVSVALGALLGIGVHLLIISPILGSAPINQLLATGGLLFFLQSFATFLWTTDHRSVRVTLPTVELGGMFLSLARLIAFVVALLVMLGLYLFLRHTYVGTAIRAVSQDRDAMALMGANPRTVYLVTSAVGGALAGVAAALLIIQYSVHPFFGAAFGPLTFMICVLGGLGNMVGAFVASFIMSEVISIGGVVWSTEMGYVIAFVFFVVMIFARPGGILGRRA